MSSFRFFSRAECRRCWTACQYCQFWGILVFHHNSSNIHYFWPQLVLTNSPIFVYLAAYFVTLQRKPIDYPTQQKTIINSRDRTLKKREIVPENYRKPPGSILRSLPVFLAVPPNEAEYKLIEPVHEHLRTK